MTTRAPVSDRSIRLLLILLTIAVRAPFWRTFDFVTFDGAFYINQAKALLHGSLGGGVFSIGYPLVIAPFVLVMGDDVAAARLVSLLAALGSTLLMYELCRMYTERVRSAVGAAILSTTPLFVQASLLSNAESALVFWIMLAVVGFAKAHNARSGIAIGMAAATRPEALAVAGALALVRARVPRAMLVFALAFAGVYAINVVAVSLGRGAFVPLSRSGAYGSAAAPWQVQEKALAFEGREALVQTQVDGEAPYDRTADYAARLPKTLWMLVRQLLPVVPLLALVGAARRPRFVWATLAPLPFLPLFAPDREQTRWLIPYLPALVFYATLALEAVRPVRARTLATWLVVLSMGACWWINRSLLERGPESDFDTVRDIARRFSDRVEPGDMIADRKPYFALYAGGRYVEIPVAPYDDTIDYLARSGVKYLSLHPNSIALRPALLPLVYDASAVRGEPRYRQVLVEPTGEMVLERARSDDPLTTRALTQSQAVDFAPAWSPDGSRLAFRRSTPDGAAIWIVDASGANARELVRSSLERDALSWSPDGKRIAYASMVDRQLDLFAADVATARVAPLFESPDFEWSPSWSRASGALVFCGDPGGLPSVWMLEANREPVRLSTDTPADLASVSPSGKLVTWVDLEGRLVVLDVVSQRTRTIEEPRQILSVASWSADERSVALEAYDWGSSNLYLIDVNEGRALLLTRDIAGEGMPSWSPRGDEIAYLLDRNGAVGLSVLGNVSSPLARLFEADDVRVFDRPDVTRVAPRENLRRVRAAPERP